MATLWRGLTNPSHLHLFRLPSTLRATVIPPRPQPLQPRIGSSCRCFAFSPSRLSLSARNSSIRSYVNSDPVLRTVIQTREPVLLYERPNNRYYLGLVYGFASICVAGGLWTWKFRVDLREREGLAFFVGPTYTVVGAIFLAIGLYTFTAPVRRMTSLDVIPSISGGPIQLRIRARNAPFTREHVIYASIGDVTISEKTVPMKQELLEAQRARTQKLSEGLEHMSVIPFAWEYAARWIEQKWTSFFLRFKFAVLRFGIIEMEVDGDKWKIDCSGYLREDGKAIDRLISEA